MAIAHDALDRARAARARIDELERSLELARAGYHDAVRAIHRQGASLRELAAGLGMSHQRVHQIIDGAGASASATPARALSTSCDFCGADREQGSHFVPGPGAGICGQCVEGAEISTGGAHRTASGAFFTRVDPNATTCCSFCKKNARQVNRLVGTETAAVCSECLTRCREILDRKRAAADGPSRSLII